MTSFEMVYVLGGTLLHSLWQGLLILGAMWVLLRVLKAEAQLNAAARYAVCASALVALVVLMGITAWRIPAENKAGQYTEFSPPFEYEDTESRSSLSGTAVEETAEISTALFSRDVREVPRAEEAVREVEPAAVARSQATSEGPAGSAWRMPRWRLVLPGPVKQSLPLLLGLWVFGMGLAVDRLVRGYLYLQRLKQTSRPLPLAASRALEGLAKPHRAVQIRVAPALAAPVAAGLTKPMVLLPPSLLDDLAPEHLSQVVLHELAHLERWDDWTNLMQQIVGAVLFFNPAVHGLGRQMERYRELACDDWVVAQTHRPHSYASCLTRLIELDLRARSVRMAPGMAVRKEQVFERVRRLLDPERTSTVKTLTSGTVAAAGILLLFFIGIAYITPVFALSGEPRPMVPASELAPRVAAPDEPAPSAAPQPEPVGDATSVVAEEEDAVDSVATQILDEAVPPVAEGSETEALGDVVLSLEPERLATLPVPAPAQRTIREAADALDLSVRAWLRVFQSAEGIGSSSDRARFLIEAAGRMPESPEVFAAYMQAARSIGSSGDRKRALAALLEAQPLGITSLRHMLDVVKDIPSSGDKTHVLLLIAEKLPDDEALRAAFIDATESLPSSSDYRRVMEAVTDAWR